MNAKRFIDELFEGLKRRDSECIARVFNMRSKLYESVFFNQNQLNYLNNLFESGTDAIYTWYETVNYHLLARNSVIEKDFLNAFKYQSRSFKALVDMLKEAKEENWQLPVLFTASVDLRLLAYACDKAKQNLTTQQTNDGEQKPDEHAEKAAESLMECFRSLCTDMRADSQVSKRWCMMHIVNQLFKIYFKINQIHLCTFLKRAVENSGLKDQFPQLHQITYKFYVGRQAMFDNDYEKAAAYYEYAFLNCPKSYIKNKKIILVYWIPFNMLRGIMPKEELLLKYNLNPFVELVRAVKQGNVRRFNQVMLQYEEFFIQNGVYLFLEKLKMTVYRNLFKKIASMLKTVQIPIEAFVSALEYLEEEDVDTDFCQCILSNLIYENKIKGYISHKHNKLVISKDFRQAFPRLSTVSRN